MDLLLILLLSVFKWFLNGLHRHLWDCSFMEKQPLELPHLSLLPRTLSEVMQNSLHFEYFRNFLRLHNAEAPLLFCLTVEDIKKELDPRIQQMQINECVRTYFLSPIPPGMPQASLSFYLRRLEIGSGMIHYWSLPPCCQPQDLLPVLCSCLTSLDGPSVWCPMTQRGERAVLPLKVSAESSWSPPDLGCL